MSVSGAAVPGKITGWTQVLVDDFETDVPRGKFVGHPAYTSRWAAFNTGWRTTPPWKAGWYDNSILEVDDSCLILNVHTDPATQHPLTAALRPKLGPAHPWGGCMSLRRSIRFKCDPLPGYKFAWLLWPDSTFWPKDGEIDFPECGLTPDETIKGFMHRQDATQGSDQASCRTEVSAADGEWHTATISWKSGSWRTPLCSFTLDGEQVARWTARVPNGPLHEVIQTEPELQWERPSPKVAGRVYIDWYVAYVAA